MRGDLRTMLWKETRQARGGLVNELVVPGIFALITGVAVPFLLLGDPEAAGALPAVAAGLVVFSALFYGSLSSEGSFSDEVREGTLRMLLTTGIEPGAIFLAKWLALMARTTIFLAAVVLLQLLTFLVRAGGLTILDPRWVLLSVGFGILVCSYVAAANGVVSLVARTTAQMRQLGMLVSLIPFAALAGLAHWMGMGRAALILTSFLLFALALSAFLFAVLAFRSERIRS